MLAPQKKRKREDGGGRKRDREEKAKRRKTEEEDEEQSLQQAIPDKGRALEVIAVAVPQKSGKESKRRPKAEKVVQEHGRPKALEAVEDPSSLAGTLAKQGKSQTRLAGAPTGKRKQRKEHHDLEDNDGTSRRQENLEHLRQSLDKGRTDASLLPETTEHAGAQPERREPGNKDSAERTSDSKISSVRIESAKGEGITREGDTAPRSSKHNGRRATSKKERDNSPAQLNEQVRGSTKQLKTIDSKSSKHQRRRKRYKTKVELHDWNLSEPVGGRFVDIEPIFSVDEKYLFIATARSVNVYSTRTSLLVRTLAVDSGQVSAFALSGAEPHVLYIASPGGQLVRCSWVRREQLGRWYIERPIYAIYISTVEGSNEDTVYTIGHNEPWNITAHILRDRSDARKTEFQTLYNSTEPVRSVKVLCRGAVIVAVLYRKIIVGYAKEIRSNSLENLQYVWREVRSVERITCFDAQLAPQSYVSNPKKPRAGGRSLYPSVNVLVGCSTGAIYVHEDLLNRLRSVEQSRTAQNHPQDVLPRKLHWHRDAVNTAKWSLDGNYIISGGRETTLVIWQLDTGKKQFLPNLTSIIEFLVVSPTGSSYAIRLADNSVMVISTTELKPTANVAGIQSRSIASMSILPSPQSFASPKEIRNQKTRKTVGLRTPSAISHSKSNQLLLAVPGSQPFFDELNAGSSMPFLQTFDISSSSHVSRQALARTNTTMPNIGGNGEELHEPSVKFLGVSHDGRWLVTVDEWAPSESEVDDQDATVSQNRYERLEVYLRFWAWNAEMQEWALEIRIDAPHLHPNGHSSGHVFGLAADPSSSSFATIGNDAVVRVWRPRRRLRYGLTVLDKNGEPLVNWSCKHAIELDRPVPQLEDDALYTIGVPVNGHLAFSPDGSVLAANVEYPEQSMSPIHFISTSTGGIHYTRADYGTSPVVGIAFLTRHLVVITITALTVWDLVTDTLLYGFTLRLPLLASTQLQDIALLAANPAGNTFAVAIPVADSISRTYKTSSHLQSVLLSKATTGNVIVWDPTTPQPLWVAEIPYLVSALLPARGEGAKGYVVLDAAAEVRTLNPRGAVGIPLVERLMAGNGAIGEEVRERDAEGVDVLGAEQLKAKEHDSEGQRDEQEKIESADVEMEDGAPTSTGIDVTRKLKKTEKENEIDADLDGKMGDDDTTGKPVVRPEQLAELFESGAMMNVRDIFDAVVGLYERKPSAKGVPDGGS